MKGHLTLNRAEVCVIGRDHTGADTPCRQGDQHIEGQLEQFGSVIVLSSSESMENLSGLQPLLLRWRQHLASAAQFKDKLSFDGCSSPAKQFVEHNGRAPDDEGRLQQTKREAAGSEILNVDCRVEQCKLSGRRRRHRACPHRYSAGGYDHARPFP